MHIERLKIREFRNLKDVEIHFTRRMPAAADTTDESRKFNSHAVIGQNGSGKSNLLEAMITIFRDLDLNNAATLDYEMDYTVRGNQINLAAEAGKKPKVMINDQRSSATALAEHAREYLPSHVFVYYSGKNERIENLFQAHQKRFTQQLRKGQDELIRRLFYCRGGHSQLVLLACLLSKDPVFTRLLNDLNIIALDSALFVLKQPHHLRQKLNENDLTEGDNRFWYARGTVVNEFLDKLWELAVAPIDEIKSKQIDFRGRTENQAQLYLFLPDEQALQKLGEMVGPPEIFFRYAEGAYIGDLIDEVRITIKHRDNDGNIRFDQLSEGELQLLTVLGLMRITSQDHCLFLLDEPDTHLNPIWKLRYFEEIERVIRADEDNPFSGDSQIIITTHDPMMIGSLRREQVRILRTEKGASTVGMPDEHPQGMGVSGLLKSEMFGLPSTLDSHTLKRLGRRNELLARKAKQGITPEEQTELRQLREYLEDLGFAHENRDPMYQLFIEKMYNTRKLSLDRLYSADELAAQEALAERIIRELVKREKTDDLSAIAKRLNLI